MAPQSWPDKEKDTMIRWAFQKDPPGFRMTQQETRRDRDQGEGSGQEEQQDLARVRMWGVQGPGGPGAGAEGEAMVGRT